MFYVQASCGPGQTVLKPSISAFNMLRLEDQHSGADEKLLEDVCLAHASWAEKICKELQQPLTESENIPSLKT